MMPDKIERGFKRRSEKDRYQTCCAVCHIKCGTVLLGAIEAVVAIFVLIGVTQQIMWKNESSSTCSRNLFRDCLIFQFQHFNVTLILDYIVVLMMICILASIFMMMCGILSDTSCLVLPHLIVQALFLLFSFGYFLFYAWSYFYGDLYIHSRPFKVQSLIERMWLAALLLVLAGFQTYLFSAVVRCSMYLSGIEDKRRERATAFERCSERVRVAKENGLWRTTSWGGGFQQYKGQYDDRKPKKEPKGFRVKWNFNQNVVVEDEETPIIDKEETKFDPKSVSEKPVRTSESPRHAPKHHHPQIEQTPTTSTHEHKHHEHRRSIDMRVHSESPKKERPRHHAVVKTSSEGSADLPNTSENQRSRFDTKRRESNRENVEPRHSSSSSPKREHRSKEIKETAVVIKPTNKHVQRPPLRSNQSVESADSVALSVASTTRSRHLTRQSTDAEEQIHKIKHEKRHDPPVVKKISISSTSHPLV